MASTVRHAAALAMLLGLGTIADDATARDRDGAAEKGKERDGDAPRSRVLARGEPLPDEAPSRESPSDAEKPAEETSPEGDEPAPDAGAPGDAETPAEEPLRAPRSVKNMDVRARDLRLRDSSMTRLESLAARYHAATGHRLVVTGGYRNVRRQAELMAAKLAHGDDIAALYAERAAAIEIRDAYRAGADRGLRKAALVDLVEEVIEAQIARGVWVSLHLRGRAADVRSRGMTEAQLDALIRAVRAEPGTVLVDERDGKAPHLHVKL